jgi:hypothetical protein
MRRRSLWLMAAGMACLFFVAACARDKEPAEQAVKAAEEALSGAKGEIAKYAPDQMKGLEDALKAAKDKLEKKEYTEALNAAKDLPGKVKDAAAAAAAKKAELTKNWEAVSAEMPKMLGAIQGQMDILAKAKKLPKGIDKAKLEGAKASLGELNQAWADAEKASKEGNLSAAMGKMPGMKEKAAEIMNSLGMPPAKS